MKQKTRESIFIVVATEGEYEERDWWIVAAFEKKREAEIYQGLAQAEELRVQNIYQKRLEKSDGTKPVAAPKNKYDRARGPYRIGATYHVETQDLFQDFFKASQ
jgi:hypothetical protein